MVNFQRGGNDSSFAALPFGIRFRHNSVSSSGRKGNDRVNLSFGLAFPQQFPLQINDLPDVMVGMAGAR